jgi:hypothetical protein
MCTASPDVFSAQLAGIGTRILLTLKMASLCSTGPSKALKTAWHSQIKMQLGTAWRP